MTDFKFGTENNRNKTLRVLVFASKVPIIRAFRTRLVSNAPLLVGWIRQLLMPLERARNTQEDALRDRLVTGFQSKTR
jgi:hypothetical protein